MVWPFTLVLFQSTTWHLPSSFNSIAGLSKLQQMVLPTYLDRGLRLIQISHTLTGGGGSPRQARGAQRMAGGCRHAGQH